MRQVFENIAYTFINTKILKFEWLFKQPITIAAVVKPSSIGGTILRVKSVKNKKIPYNEISFIHPEVVQNERSGEAKKYTYHSRQNYGSDEAGMALDEEAEGTTDNFDLIEMDNQVHEYARLPKLTKIRKNSNKQRTQEDENTKRYYIDDNGRRSTADIGGNKVARGVESKSLHEIQAQGELADFINVLKVLEGYPEIKSINVIMDVLPDGHGERKFKYLSNEVTRRKYVVADIELMNTKSHKIIEVERESKSLSTIILFQTKYKNYEDLINRLLMNLVNSNGVWQTKHLQLIQSEGLIIRKLKHSSTDLRHRASLLFNKIT